MNKAKTIGIIGGAGPMASCKLYQLIVEICRSQYGSTKDADFPEIRIISYPFAAMLAPQAAHKNRTLLIRQLQDCFDSLAQQEATILAIACNTLHIFVDAIAMSKKSTFIHIARATREYAEKRGLKKLLFLGTSTSAASKLYADCIRPAPDNQKLVDGVITNILSGTAELHDAQTLAKIVQKYPADGVILGCTELPLLHAQYPRLIAPSCVVLDTLEILAHALVHRSFS